jgi:ubiquinone/menaquinone biosynthesis C-methylase UbiE
MSASDWDLVAAAYDAEVTPMFEAFAIEALRLAEVNAGATVIDVACGSGALTTVAARAGNKVEAIDSSEQMIARLNAKALQGVTARVGDGQALPFANDAFSGGFSLFGLMLFEDRAKGFAELRRVMAPNAKAVVTSWLPLDDTPVFAAFYGALRDAMAKEGIRVEGAATAPNPLSTRDDFFREMSVSFREVTISQFEHIALFPTIADLAASLLRTIPSVVSVRAAVGAEKFAPVDRAIADAIGRTITEPKLVMPALFGVGKASAN